MAADLLAGHVIDYGMVMSVVLACSIPAIIVFFLLQKSFAESITSAVK